MKMTWGEIKALGGKGKDSLTTLGDSTYSSDLLAKAFQKLPTDTVAKDSKRAGFRCENDF